MLIEPQQSTAHNLATLRRTLQHRDPALLRRVKHLRTGTALVAVADAYRLPHHKAGDTLADICTRLIAAIERSNP